MLGKNIFTLLVSRVACLVYTLSLSFLFWYVECIGYNFIIEFSYFSKFYFYNPASESY